MAEAKHPTDPEACHHPGLSCRGADILAGGQELERMGGRGTMAFMLGVACGLAARRVLDASIAGPLEDELHAFMTTDEHGVADGEWDGLAEYIERHLPLYPAMGGQPDAYHPAPQAPGQVH